MSPEGQTQESLYSHAYKLNDRPVANWGKSVQQPVQKSVYLNADARLVMLLRNRRPSGTWFRRPSMNEFFNKLGNSNFRQIYISPKPIRRDRWCKTTTQKFTMECEESAERPPMCRRQH